MKKKLSPLALIAVLFVVFYHPLPVWERVVPSWGDDYSVHYEFNCWIQPYEKYSILGKEDVDGMIYVANADYSCAGSAKVEDVR